MEEQSNHKSGNAI